MKDVLSFCRALPSRAATVPERQALFRREITPRGYSGVGHFAFSVVATAPPAAAAWVLVGSWGLAELVAIVLGLFAGSTIVYGLHRFPMHRSLPGLGTIYDLHTRCHHMMFDEENTEIESSRDLYMVMFPPRYTVGLSALGIPLLVAPLFLISADVMFAFAGVAYLYFLAYELVHLAAHLPRDSKVANLPVLRTLVRHHQVHHAWDTMHHYNFSMVIPLWDYVLGTKK